MRIMLIGDSIRMGYQPLVAEKLKGRADVYGPEENCLTSMYSVARFDTWIEKAVPDILTFNFGLHDSNVLSDGRPNIVVEQYALNVWRFIEKARARKIPRLIWVTTTPCYRVDAAVPVSEWVVNTAAIHAQFRYAALEVIHGENIEVVDMYPVMRAAGPTYYLPADGTHMTEAGKALLADTLCGALRIRSKRG